MKTGPLVVMTRLAGGPWNLHVDDVEVRIADATVTMRPDGSLRVQRGAVVRDVRPGRAFDLKAGGRDLEAVAFRAEEDERAKMPGIRVMKALEAVRAQDTEDARRVLSDVLEESGALAEAQYVRHELMLQAMKDLEGEAFLKGVRELRALSAVVGPTFRYLVGRDIEGCAGVRWAFRCPQSWDGMKRTARESERVCTSCRQLVVQVWNEDDAKQLAREGVCARLEFDDWEGEVAAEPEEPWVGTVEPEPEPRAEPVDPEWVTGAAMPPRPRDPPQWVGSVAVMPPVSPSSAPPSSPREPVKEEKRAPWWKRLFGR